MLPKLALKAEAVGEGSGSNFEQMLAKQQRQQESRSAAPAPRPSLPLPSPTSLPFPPSQCSRLNSLAITADNLSHPLLDPVQFLFAQSITSLKAPVPLRILSNPVFLVCASFSEISFHISLFLHKLFLDSI